MDRVEVSVIIPANDEDRTVGHLVKRIKALYPEFEIIVINDGSSDETGKVARDAGAIVYTHPYNMGNGAAIKSGIRIASGEVLVFMDGDGQHNPEDIERLIEWFPQYDMVVGARTKGNRGSRVRALGNWIFNLLASYVSKFPVEDLTSGFRAINADLAHNLLYLLPNTYSYPTTLTLGVLRNGKSLKYVPIGIQARQEGKSSIRAFRDGIRFFMIITKICVLYSPLRIFLPVSFLMFCLGLSHYLYTFLTMRRFTNMSALLFTTSVLIFMMGLISEQISQMRFERSEGDRYT
ncbi:MAG: glycosyltransferase family 2 protein [Deltaproteobacteria bacterium]|nr:glycosyltransferase family 2 protein [Deltaproteobacteria bacterium]MBW2113083.1 glycosyltransferase family 2 protein [Deltaproteobacteria bacterium]MBW2354234.1 glycosyltransferase family 2 protein [Deltaproteobacteria bacterium]